jgi:hypothetical protein
MRQIWIAAAVAGAALGAMSSSASAAPAQTAVADVTSGPFHIQFNAQRPANSPPNAATGNFIAHATVGSLTLMTLQGPVTCLDVRGNRMGLFYPVKSSNPPLFAQLNGGVFVYLTLDNAGKPQFSGFLPVPFTKVSSCAPGLALMPVTSGTATLTS